MGSRSMRILNHIGLVNVLREIDCYRFSCCTSAKLDWHEVEKLLLLNTRKCKRAYCIHCRHMWVGRFPQCKMQLNIAINKFTTLVCSAQAEDADDNETAAFSSSRRNAMPKQDRKPVVKRTCIIVRKNLILPTTERGFSMVRYAIFQLSTDSTVLFLNFELLQGIFIEHMRTYPWVFCRHKFYPH